MGKLLNFTLPKEEKLEPSKDVCTISPVVLISDNIVKVVLNRADAEVFARYGVQGTMTWGDCVLLYMQGVSGVLDDEESLDWVFIESLLKIAYAKKVSLDISCGVR